MIIYRPHRGSFDEAMKEAKEFHNEQEMFLHIVQTWTDNSPFPDAPFSIDDLSISNDSISDYRNGWEDTRYVCTRRCYNEVYPIPQAIGVCATRYRK